MFLKIATFNETMKSLLPFCKLYTEFKDKALCLDIETTKFDGPISVVGLYKPQDGLIDSNYSAYIKGQNLTTENLKQAFSGCKLLITYNGLAHDIPKIKEQFLGVIPEDVKVLDLYLFTRKLYMNTNLKVIENTLGIERLHEESKKRGQAIRLWWQYQKYNNQNALSQLLEYNKQDAANLHPIAEKFIQEVKQRMKAQDKIKKDQPSKPRSPKLIQEHFQVGLGPRVNR